MPEEMKKCPGCNRHCDLSAPSCPRGEAYARGEAPSETERGEGRRAEHSHEHHHGERRHGEGREHHHGEHHNGRHGHE